MQSGAFRDWTHLEAERNSGDQDTIRKYQRVIWYVLALVGAVELLLGGWLVGTLLHR